MNWLQILLWHAPRGFIYLNGKKQVKLNFLPLCWLCFLTSARASDTAVRCCHFLHSCNLALKLLSLQQGSLDLVQDQKASPVPGIFINQHMLLRFWIFAVQGNRMKNNRAYTFQHIYFFLSIAYYFKSIAWFVHIPFKNLV